VPQPLDGLIITAGLINLATGLGELFPFRSRGATSRGLASDGLQAWGYLRGRPISPWPDRKTVHETRSMTEMAAGTTAAPIAKSSVPPPSSEPPLSL
jgi:hypothetical protein